jgi:hypothetical protein
MTVGFGGLGSGPLGVAQAVGGYPDEDHLTTVSALKQYLDPPPSGGIYSVDVTSGGSGYGAGVAATVADPIGTGATLSVQVSNGVVVGVQVVTPGSGYRVPTVVITGGGGSGAIATPSIGVDAVLDALIKRASATISQSTNIPTIFDSGSDITEKRNGNGKDRIITKSSPLVSVTSVTIDGVSIPASPDGIAAGYIVDDTMLYLVGYTFTKGVQNVTLVYRGGVTLGSSLQQMLEHACLVTCALWWKRRAHVDQASIGSPQLGTISYTQKDLPAEAMTIINQIRRVAPITP